MTAAIDQLDICDDCLARTCEKQGCAVDLAGVPKPFCLIDMDHPASPAAGSRCDYLFIGVDGQNLHVVPLELKSTGFHAASVSRQLTGGARAAERVVRRAACRFEPMVAHAGAHRRQIRELAKWPVPFRGRKYVVKVLRCGARLADAR